MKIPLSSTGSTPITHWFCFLNATEEGYAKLMSLKNYSIMEEAAPKEFLEKWNLKIIR